MVSRERQALLEEAVVHLEEGRPGEALVALRQLQAGLAKGGTDYNRVRSYYGYTLVCLGEQTEGLAVCRDAADSELNDPVVFYNLARAALHCGQRRLALHAIGLGRVAGPGFAELERLRRRMGVRRQPVLRFLSRDNPLNIILGRMRHRRLAPARM